MAEKIQYLSDLVEKFGFDGAVKYAVENFGMSEGAARFYIRLEMGEIDGDLEVEGTDDRIPGVGEKVLKVIAKYDVSR